MSQRAQRYKSLGWIAGLLTSSVVVGSCGGNGGSPIAVVPEDPSQISTQTSGVSLLDPGEAVIITGLLDGTLSGGAPKAIEIYVQGTVDLSALTLQRSANGGSFGTNTALSGTYTDEFVYLVGTAGNGQADFEAVFGTSGDFGNIALVSGNVSGNGNDGFRILEGATVLDQVWEENASDSYLDSYWYRNDGTGPDGAWVPGNWTTPGNNALDGLDAAGIEAAVPFGTYSPDGGSSNPLDLVVNELRISSPGSGDNTSNFAELFGDPGLALNGLTLVVLSGEFEPGQVDFAFDLTSGSTDTDGVFLVANPGEYPTDPGDLTANFDFFGSPSTFLLVDGFSGSQGDDLDTNNDGTLDVEPWTSVLDSVSLIDGDSDPDQSYGSTIVGPSGDFPPAGIARDPNGTGDFRELAFNDLSEDTPGELNSFSIVIPSTIPIYDIQGAAQTSPLLGQSVTTTGIVTAVDTNGFYLQDPTGDGAIATSDAIFVFTSSVPGVNVGDELEVTGTVSEFTPGGTSTRNLSTTQISGNPTITVVSTGNTLPAPVIIGAGGRVPPTENIDDDAFASFDPETDGIDFFESLEAMLVTAQNAKAIAGTNRFGEIFTVVDNGAGATGISARGTLNISPNDFNPEKVQIDEDTGILPGFSLPQVDVGAMLGDVTGVISYDFGNFQIQPTQPFAASASGLSPENSPLTPGDDQLLIASYNVLNLDPKVEDVAKVQDNDPDDVDDDLGDGRFDAIGVHIATNLNLPDILCLQEVQDNTGAEINDGVIAADVTLQRLIDRIPGGSAYQFIDNTFITEGASGGQPGGNIRTAFLYNPNRVSLIPNSVQTIDSQNPGGAFEGARLPLVASFAFKREEITLVCNHFSSKGGSAPIFGVEQPFEARQEDVTVNGSLDERQAQSAAVQSFVSSLLSDPNANVVVLGDLNEFEFVSPVTGLESIGLFNLINTLPDTERYSFIFQGNSQELDHILVSNNLTPGAQVDVVHVNSEFVETDQRASDHDPVLASFSVEAGVEEVTSFTLIDTASDQPILDPIPEGASLNLAELPSSLSIRANTAPTQVGSVVLELQGPVSRTQTENVEPYSLFSDREGDFAPWQPSPPPLGNYTLTATPFSGDNGTGTPGIPLTLSFEVTFEAAVTSFILVDANTDTDLVEIQNGDVLDLSTLPPQLSIKANTNSSQVESVVLELQGPVSRTQTEDIEPYSLFSDRDGDFAPWQPSPPPLGNYTLTATPFSESRGRGAAGSPLTIEFDVVSNGLSLSQNP